MAVNPYETQPLQTPVASKRKISAIGRGKASFITWKNGLLALGWLILMALISFLIIPNSVLEMWKKAIIFGCLSVPGLCFFLIPVPGKDYYWIYNYVFDSIRFWFAKSANTMPNLGSTSEFIPFSYIKGNKLFFKGESSVQGFWRLNGRNIYSCASEIQSGLLNNFHDLIKNLHNSTIKIIGFKANFKLTQNYKWWKSILEENEKEYINSSFLPISVLEWQNWQFRRNFPFYKDFREDLPSQPIPRDMVYLLVITGDSELVVDELGKMMVPNLAALDGSFVEEATNDDIKMYIKKQFGLTSVDTLNGFDVKIDPKTNATIENFNDIFSNMHSMIFKPKYWKTTDWKQIGTLSKTHYHRLLTINSFKTDADLGWLDPFFEDAAVDCIQIKVQEIPIDKQTKLIGKAINQYTKVEKSAGGAGSFASAKLSDTFTFLKELEAETNKSNVTLVKTTFYIKISADSLENLNKKEIELKAALKKQLGLDKKNYDAFWFRQRDALLSSLGVLNDKLSPKIGINVLSSALALGWPFNNPRLIQPKGFHLGFTSNGMCPICLDIVGERSLSGMIVGKTGSGKSLLAKLLSINILLNKRNKLFWFDPENEMSKFGKNMNATQIDLTSQVPVIDKIEFGTLMHDFLEENLSWNPKKFLLAYMALLDLPRAYKYMHGLSSEEIKNLMKQNKFETLNQEIKYITLINETMDYFGLGSLKNHSKLVSITNSQITPLMVKDQIAAFESRLKTLTKLENVSDIASVYTFIYEKCVQQSNINPYRIVVKSQTDMESLDAFGVYQQHKQMLLTWFKQLCPKADSIGTIWFNSTLDELYSRHLHIIQREENFQQVTNMTTKQIINWEKYPTIQDHYDIMLEEFEELKKFKNHPSNQTKDIKERIRVYNEILSVFDNLVEHNRYEKQGLFYYLWNKDHKFNFSEDKKLIIFNIQNLLQNVKNIKENNYTDQIKFDFQNIFNAQYYLSQQIIWSYVVNNRIHNDRLELPKDKQSHVFIFMDEAHASLKQPQFVDWSVNLIKRARKYQAGLWLITQSIGDYLKLADAAELFNNFMFKFYFQSEAQAFDDILKKFQISKVPLTVSEERWLNPLLGNTTQGRCLLTFEDGKRYMMSVTTSVNYIINILEHDLMSNEQYKVWIPGEETPRKFGPGVAGWLNYLRSSPSQIKRSELGSVLKRAYRSWLANNEKKFDYNDWVRNKLAQEAFDAEAKKQIRLKGQQAIQESYIQSKKEKQNGK